MAAASFEPGRTGPYELLLSRTLDNTLRRARALDLESLCILAKKLVWSIRVDVHFLDHDGGLVDAACVAVIAALCAFRREDVEVRGEEVEIVYPQFSWVPGTNEGVSIHGTATSEVGDIAYSSYHDVFFLFTACTACCGTRDDDCGKYVTRRTGNSSRRHVRRRTTTEWEFHRYLYSHIDCANG